MNQNTPTDPIALQPVIIAGGSGTRLWPLSRAHYPKQFLALQGPQSLFQLAVRRLGALAADDIAVAPACVVGHFVSVLTGLFCAYPPIEPEPSAAYVPG